jgi:putative heme iron utilization protein
MTDALAAARTATADFRAQLRTLVLGTAASDGTPDASIAPAIVDRSGAFVICISGLAAHTRNLRANPRASVLLAADEAATPQPFARRRLTFTCTAQPVARGTPEHAALFAALREKFGPTLDVLAGLPDFDLVRLVPTAGRLVLGFGAAYDVAPLDWQTVTPVSRPAR